MSKTGSVFVGFFIIIAVIGGGARPITAQNDARAIAVDLKSFVSALSPDGKTLAIAAQNFYNDQVQPDLLPIRLFDLTSGKETGRWQGVQTDFAAGLVFTPDGKRLISIHTNGQLIVWDVGQGQAVKSYPLLGFSYQQPKFMSDGKRVALLSYGSLWPISIIDSDNSAITAFYGRLFKTRADFEQNSVGPQAADLHYVDYDLSPDNKTLAAANGNDEIDLWDVATGKMTVAAQPAEKKMGYNIRPMLFTPDGKSLVYYHRDENRLHILDIDTLKDSPQSVSGGVNFALSAKGDEVAWADKAHVFTSDFHVAQPTKIADLPTNLTSTPITALYFSPDAKQLVVAGLAARDGKNQIYIISLG